MRRVTKAIIRNTLSTGVGVAVGLSLINQGHKKLNRDYAVCGVLNGNEILTYVDDGNIKTPIPADAYKTMYNSITRQGVYCGLMATSITNTVVKTVSDVIENRSNIDTTNNDSKDDAESDVTSESANN